MKPIFFTKSSQRPNDYKMSPFYDKYKYDKKKSIRYLNFKCEINGTIGTQ